MIISYELGIQSGEVYLKDYGTEYDTIKICTKNSSIVMDIKKEDIFDLFLVIKQYRAIKFDVDPD